MATKKPGKKTKKQLAMEKKLAKLKKEEKTVARKANVLSKRVEKERAANQRKIDAFDKQISKLEDKRDAIYDKKLPSGRASDKIQDKLLKLRNQIRELDYQLKAATPLDDEERRPDREAGEDSEE